MIKHNSLLTYCGLAAVIICSSSSPAEAGIIPWTYNAIFGPVGSTFGPGPYVARRPLFAPRQVYYGAAYYPAVPVAPSYGCNTCNYGVSYSSGYTPYYSSYGYADLGCSTCGTIGCNNCCAQGGCASGNCNSYTPATGMTSPSPAPQTPTSTFKSTSPTVNPDAVNRNNSTYDDNGNSNGFQQPLKSEPNNNNGSNNSNGSNQNDSPNAPPFGTFDGTYNESLKVPMTPLVPVEQHQPAPAEAENKNSLDLRFPTPSFEPAPVAIDETSVSMRRIPAPSRVARTAQYGIPTVVRHVPENRNPLLPPLPSPVQVAVK